jgi:hypothetical protein
MELDSGTEFPTDNSKLIAPCDMNNDSNGWTCPLEIGECTLCFLTDEFNWSSMAHEHYGLQYPKHYYQINSRNVGRK